MKSTVELINEWANFKEQHPNADIDDFCRYYLKSREKKEVLDEVPESIIPLDSKMTLLKVMGRTSRLFTVFADDALQETGLRKFEEFLYLITIAHANQPKKTEVIYHMMGELSTGLNILNHLRELNYITEFDDPEDRRSRRLKLSEEGEKILKICHDKVHWVAELFLQDMPENEVQLAIHMLKDIEIKFSKMYMQNKGKGLV